ncbi:hypothetical protein [Streptococcus halichoeri]
MATAGVLTHKRKESN